LNNAELVRKYDSVYREGSSQFYSFNGYRESSTILDMVPNWQDLNVLEIGCGEGRLATMISFAGARHVDAVDYSAEAIKIAERRFNIETVTFRCADYKTLSGPYDVVVMQGVLEHLDKPFEELGRIVDSLAGKSGIVITSSPSFVNPRGYVWMTLQLLFDVPMSLSDLHFLAPADFEAFARERGCTLQTASADQDWGGGERLLIDFRRRLPNALRDAKLDASRVDRLLQWLAKTLPYQAVHEYSGANLVYKLTKHPSLSAV
jgi:SAM-dependent methyltransferase